jgi:oligo-1,6-glucosidase
VGQDRNELNMIFQFQIHEMKEWSLTKFKNIQKNWYEALKGKGWNSLYLNNHDQPRQVSRYGNDREYRVESAKMLATMLHTLQGTPYIYQGEEIGMTNVAFPSIGYYDDIDTVNKYNEMVRAGKDPGETLKLLQPLSRDNARTPMQWNDSEHAGFTSGKPWLKVNPNYAEINVVAALNNRNSIFYHYKKLISLRKANDVMIYGDFHDLLPRDREVYAYTRTLGPVEWMILLNFSDAEKDVGLGRNAEGQIMLSNYPDYRGEGQLAHLRPYEAVILQM